MDRHQTEADPAQGNRVELRENPGRGRRDDRHLPDFATSRPHVIEHNTSEAYSDTTSSDRQRRRDDHRLLGHNFQ